MLTDIFTNKHLYLLFLLSNTVTIPVHNKEVSTFILKSCNCNWSAAVVGAGVTIIYRRCYPSKPAPKIQSLRGPGSSASTLNKTALTTESGTDTVCPYRPTSELVVKPSLLQSPSTTPALRESGTETNSETNAEEQLTKECVKYLRNYRHCDANCPKLYCRTNCLRNSCRANCPRNLNAIATLLQSNTNPNTCMIEKDNVLSWATLLCLIDLVELLLKHGANTETPNFDYQTPLSSVFYCSSNEDNYYSCKHNIPRIVELLLKHDADINAQDSNGNTALIQLLSNIYMTVSSSQERTLTLLLQHRPQLNKKNRYNDTAYDLAHRQYRFTKQSQDFSNFLEKLFKFCVPKNPQLWVEFFTYIFCKRKCFPQKYIHTLVKAMNSQECTTYF